MWTRPTAIALCALGLSACADPADRAWEEAELPSYILTESVELDPDQYATDATNQSFLFEALDHPGRCCGTGSSLYDFPFEAVDDGTITTDAILSGIDPNATYYTITLPDPADTALVEPLFGNQMRRHVMAEPQEGCEVVSGARDGVRRAGIIAHTLPNPGRLATSYDINQVGVARCNVSALLLLHGFSDEEAMNYAAWSVKDEDFFYGIEPDFSKVNARDLELNGPIAPLTDPAD